MDHEIMSAPESELLHRIATLEAENERLRAALGMPSNDPLANVPRNRSDGCTGCAWCRVYSDQERFLSGVVPA